MTGPPPSEPSRADAPSRRARLARRRSRNVRLAVASIVAAVVALVAMGAYALSTTGSPFRAADAAGRTSEFGSRGSLAPAAAVDRPAPRPLDHAHPLRLWIGGDSLAGSFGPALGDQLGALGIVQTVIDFKVSSGLWSNDIRNWYQRASDQMASDAPDAVVFIIGTNDTPVVNQVDANHDGVPDWEAVYRLKVARMMDLLVGPAHRTVLWLGPPTLPDPAMNRGALAMGAVMQQEAAKRAPDVVYLDTYKLFSTKDGSYSRTIVDERGDTITARIEDGVHFTQSGASYLARAVFALLDARWGLTRQADLKDPIGWNFTPGSVDSVPGYRSQPTSRYRSPSPSTTAAPAVESTTIATPTTAAVVATTLAPTTVPPTTPQTSVATVPVTTAPAPPTTAKT